MPLAEADLEMFHRALDRRLQELQESINRTAESRKPVELDQASVGRLSRMDALQMQAMAQAAERMRGQEIERILSALKRIEAGDFGCCLVCGEEISPKRLELDPTAATCIRCAGARG